MSLPENTDQASETIFSWDGLWHHGKEKQRIRQTKSPVRRFGALLQKVPGNDELGFGSPI